MTVIVSYCLSLVTTCYLSWLHLYHFVTCECYMVWLNLHKMRRSVSNVLLPCMRQNFHSNVFWKVGSPAVLFPLPQPRWLVRSIGWLFIFSPWGWILLTLAVVRLAPMPSVLLESLVSSLVLLLGCGHGLGLCGLNRWWSTLKSVWFGHFRSTLSRINQGPRCYISSFLLPLELIYCSYTGFWCSRSLSWADFH